MRYYFLFFILFLTVVVFSQTKDRRAELEIMGRTDEITVTADENIWLASAVGNTYFAKSINDTWHYGKLLDEKGIMASNPSLERVSFFNRDTAIISGYISFDEQKSRKNGYYLTTDAGKTWTLKDYGGDSWIYSIQVDNHGHSWMGGSSKELYFSEDFGMNWRTIRMPYKSSDRTYGMHMIDDRVGVASSNHNEIIITNDNWKTVRYVLTPLDQKKYQVDADGYVDDRISKIVKWDNYLIVNQKGHIFYSDLTTIDWKLFPVSIVNFELDSESKELFAVTDSLKIIKFSTPTEYDYLSEKKLYSWPIDMKVVNHSLFILGSQIDIYKVNFEEFVQTLLYTSDKKIPTPRLVKKYKDVTWGLNGSQIYLSKDGDDWFREKVLDFTVDDFMLEDDSLAILWDGFRNNYKYSLKTHTLELYQSTDPIKEFLAAPIKSISIRSGSWGCFHNLLNQVDFFARNDSMMTTNDFFSYKNGKMDTTSFDQEINSGLFTEILRNWNANPFAIPSIQYFEITDLDKKNYLALVDELSEPGSEYRRFDKNVDKTFFYAVPSMLDTLDDSVLEKILSRHEKVWSTTTNWFELEIRNEQSDTLKISRTFSESAFAWNLPWEVMYKGQYFICSDIDFSRFVANCVPPDFWGLGVFDNKYLILDIANYLYERKRNR